MRSVHRTRGASRRSVRRVRLVALAATSTLVALIGCSDVDDEATTTTETTTTAPIPAPGGQPVEDLDACTLIDEERMASYLDTIEAPAVDSTSADATAIASVCGWFVEDRDEVERPDRVLLRVEPVQVEGNVVCDPPEFADTEALEVEGGDGWATLATPIETASVVDDWCVYLAAPERAAEEDATTRDATTDLLEEVQTSLPR